MASVEAIATLRRRRAGSRVNDDTRSFHSCRGLVLVFPYGDCADVELSAKRFHFQALIGRTFCSAGFSFFVPILVKVS
jgi:hypothetical protein